MRNEPNSVPVAPGVPASVTGPLPTQSVGPPAFFPTLSGKYQTNPIPTPSPNQPSPAARLTKRTQFPPILHKTNGLPRSRSLSRRGRRLHSEASIVIITAYATVDTAIAAMQEGAQEYIV